MTWRHDTTVNETGEENELEKSFATYATNTGYISKEHLRQIVISFGFDPALEEIAKLV